jgi:hypothetical protein
MIARVGILVLLVLWPITVRAERRRVLVVPTELGGHFLNRDVYRRDVGIALEDRLRAAQFIVVRSNVLSPAEADCREFACLTRIADTHGAAIVVAGRIVNNQKVKVSYHLRVRVVEKVNGQTATREREKDCDNCAESHARDALATLMSAVIANEPEPVPQVSPPPMPSPEPVVSPPNEPIKPPDNGATNGKIVSPLIPSPPQDRLTRQQRLVLRGVGFGLVGLGLLGFIQGGVEVARDGKLADANGNFDCGTACVQRRVTTEGQALFFSLGSITLLGGAAMAIVSWVPLPRPRTASAIRIIPALLPTEARLQLELSF